MLQEWKYTKWRQCWRCTLKRLALLCFIIGASVLLLKYLSNGRQPAQESLKNAEARLLLWWTTFDKTIFYRDLYCGLDVCTVTNDRQRVSEAKIILFYGSDINIYNMPLPRHEFQQWALLHDQSPQAQPILWYNNFLRHFNYTSTFSRYSDFPLTLLPLKDARELITSKYLIDFGNRSLKLVLFMEVNCSTMSGRENYVRELMSYVPVHSCGECLRNADLPSFKRDNDLLRFMARFKFILAFEDAICDDYITSTFWLSLIVGAVPIYFGSPTIRYWAPHKHSAIYISDYHSPKDLAEYIYYLDNNETAFNEYLQHKYDTNTPITNHVLLHNLIWRGGMNSMNRFEKFEREMCEEINRANKPNMKMANQKHFDCPLPQPYPAALKNQTLHVNYWKIQFSISECIAHLLDRLLQLNAPYSKTAFVSKLQHLTGGGACYMIL